MKARDTKQNSYQIQKKEVSDLLSCLEHTNECQLAQKLTQNMHTLFPVPKCVRVHLCWVFLIDDVTIISLDLITVMKKKKVHKK